MRKAPTPRLIFLSVRPEQRDLANPIANSLTDRIRASTGWAFLAPLYNAAAGMFYFCDPAFDMGKADSKVPYEPNDAWLFYPKFEQLMRAHFGSDIIARMSRDHIYSNADYFDYLIFTDGWNRNEDIAYLAREFSPADCTIVHVNNPSSLLLSVPGVRNIHCVIGPDFDRIMDALAKELEDEPELPLETPSHTPAPVSL